MTTSINYFTTPGPITQPGHHAAAFKALPADVDALRRIVQGLVLHIFWAEQYGVQHPPERQQEVQLRYVARQLDRIFELDPHPLAQARPPQRRLVGNCRDFSCLLTTMLRQHGIPARARCGFAHYFDPQRYIDHWVCEYWNAAQQRWILVDAQLDEFQSKELHIQFDPMDVPRDQFIVGGQAWQLCRSGQADPDAFGIFDLHGLWFVRGDFVRDIAALNKVELLPWDSWGLAESRDEDLTPADLALLDHLAELTRADVPDFEQVRVLYQEYTRLTVPATIHSYLQTGVQNVALALA